MNFRTSPWISSIPPRSASSAPSRAPRCASRRSRRTSRTSTPPATAARTSTSTTALHAAWDQAATTVERVDADRPDRRRRGRCAPTAARSTSTPRPPPQAKNGLQYEAIAAVMKSAHRHPQDRDRHRLMGLFDAIDVSGSGLARRAPADGRHLREPRQRRRRPRAPTASRTAARRSSSRRPAPPASFASVLASMQGRRRRQASTASASPGSPRTPRRSSASTTPATRTPTRTAT